MKENRSTAHEEFSAKCREMAAIAIGIDMAARDTVFAYSERVTDENGTVYERPISREEYEEKAAKLFSDQEEWMMRQKESGWKEFL